jgi:hypothetical protein
MSQKTETQGLFVSIHHFFLSHIAQNQGPSYSISQSRCTRGEKRAATKQYNEYGEEQRSAFDSHGRLSVAGAKDGAEATDEVNA